MSRSHLLEEAYHDLLACKADDIQAEQAEFVINEAPSQEQEWLSKNIISHLQRSIDGLNVARSHIPSYISREEVRTEVAKLQSIQQRMLDIWQNIQDVQSTSQAAAQNQPQPPK